ncbi:MAG: hypothetical protein KDE15_14925 [Erythrobacter sp.]|nr:hypothetical protein [Erythrobacter sp.]
MLGLLAACGSSGESDAQTVPGLSGDTSEIVVENAAGDAEILPEGFTVPAGTQITSNQQVTAPGGEGRLILLASTATAAELEEHFRTQAEAAGFEMRVGTNESGYRQLSGVRADGMQFDFAASPSGDGQTLASLAIGRERSN